ncbi:MAG: FHA domain-containing protein [Myxococcota bacterium]
MTKPNDNDGQDDGASPADPAVADYGTTSPNTLNPLADGAATDADSDAELDESQNITLDSEPETLDDVSAHAAPAPGADIEEVSEATAIDRELVTRLRVQHGDSEPSTTESSNPRGVGVAAGGEESISQSTPHVGRPDPGMPDNSGAAPNLDALDAIDDIGPAFPDAEEWDSVSSSSVSADYSIVDLEVDIEELPPPDEVPTNAHPGVDPANRAERRRQAPGPSEDAWAGFEDSGDGWPSLTGESQVESSTSAPQPVQGEYTRQKTDVYELGQKSQPVQGGRLICIAGADNGREYAIDQREMVVGRAPGCSIILTDNSVSREHARLLRDGDTYTLIDQRSANGTFLNNQRVDRGRMRSGDEVGFGSTRFRFLEIGDVFKPVDASGAPVLPGARLGPWHRWRANPNFKSIVAAASIVLATFIVVGTVLVARHSGGGGRQSNDRIFEYYLQGVEAFKNRQWSEAKSQFSIVVGLDPSHARGRAYLLEVTRELEWEQRMRAARVSREAGDLAQAYSQASGITDSVYTPDAVELMRDIDTEIDVRVARARTTLEAGEATEALQLLQSVEAVRPGRPDVLALRDRAVQLVEQAGKPVGSTTHSSSSSRTPSRAPSSSGSSHSSTAPLRAVGPVARAKKQFADGQLDAALDTLSSADESRDVQMLSAKMKKFKKVYENALDEHRAKRTKSAIKQLKQAKAFEAKITGGRSRVASEINRKLADMYYVQGIGSYLGGHLQESYRSFKTAVSFFPDHGPAQKKLGDLASTARRAFEAGYRAKVLDPDSARKQWKLVLQIVPSNNEHYRKAKRYLDSLK